jgi:aminopeptidase
VRAAAVVLAALGTTAGATPSIDHGALAQRIVSQLALQRGERVLLLATPGEFPALVAALQTALPRAGGTVAVRYLGARDAAALPDFDAVVVLPGASAAAEEYRAVHAALSGRRRAVHFHWRGAPPALSAWPVPGHPLPPDDVVDAVYERAVLRSNCAALGSAMGRFEAALRNGEVRVTTPAGTDLRFRIGDRPVNVQDGDASAARAGKARVRVDRDVELPCGVLRVAPLEDTVSGVVAFPPARWADQRVEGLKLRFERGRVVEIAATAGREAAETEIAGGGDAARSFREFALGFNPALAVPEHAPWIPYYGYGAGVVRLSLGDNTELGGSVSGGYVRWNFFTDATVSVGGEAWVVAGALAAR